MRASTPNNTSTTIPIITIFCQEQPTGPSDTFSETSVFQIYEILFLSAHDVNQIRSVVRKTSQSINANNSVTDVMLLGRHECHHQTDTGTGKRGNKANNEQAEKNKSSKCVCVCWVGVHRLGGAQEQLRWAEDHGGWGLYVIRQVSQKHVLCQQEFERFFPHTDYLLLLAFQQPSTVPERPKRPWNATQMTPCSVEEGPRYILLLTPASQPCKN